IGDLLRLRALAGEREALDLARALYETYGRMLAEGPPDEQHLRVAVEAVRSELRAMEDVLSRETGLELDTVAIPVVMPGEPLEILVRARGGVDQLLVAWGVEDSAGLDLLADGDGLHLLGVAETDPRTIVVHAALSGREGRLEIYVEPQAEKRPLYEIRGRVVDAEGRPVAGIRVELREDGPEGALAETPGGKPLAAETDASGWYSLPYVQPGDAWVAVLSSGELVGIRPVVFQDPAEVEHLNRIEFGEFSIGH
ncbi:MAG: carboxypeptidase-like regulatory domain-containing protein, partial [Planctomycetota bacterium]